MRLLIILFTLAGSFHEATADSPCYTTFNKASGLKTKVSESGQEASYFNKKQAQFASLKLKPATPGHEDHDSLAILDELRVQQSIWTPGNTKLLELDYNGFHIYGASNTKLKDEKFWGSFVIFTGGGSFVLIEFPAIAPEQRMFETWDEFKGLRNNFFGEYTAYLKECLK